MCEHPVAGPVDAVDLEVLPAQSVGQVGALTAPVVALGRVVAIGPRTRSAGGENARLQNLNRCGSLLPVVPRDRFLILWRDESRGGGEGFLKGRLSSVHQHAARAERALRCAHHPRSWATSGAVRRKLATIRSSAGCSPASRAASSIAWRVSGVFVAGGRELRSGSLEPGRGCLPGWLPD